jgi:hypothetical protein
MNIRLAILIAIGFAASVAFAQAPPPAAGPAVDARPLFENEAVQVFRMRIAPRERTPMHDVSPRVVVWLADAHFIDTFADGRTQEERRTAGEAEWVSARRHAGANLSDQPMEFIAVVVKSAAGPPHHH